MNKLSVWAIYTTCLTVLKWKCNEDLSGMEVRFKELSEYFQCLPNHVFEAIRTVIVNVEFLDAGGTSLDPRAEHIALFVQDNIKKLRLLFYGYEFSLKNLLHLSGSKLKYLEELKLPDDYHLDYFTSRIMCEVMPNLQILNLRSCSIDEDTMQFVANLPLVEFDPGSSISEYGIAILCRSNSKAKDTLRVLRIGDYGLPIKCYHKVLYSMEKIEDFGGEHSKWFSSLPSELEKREFNLKKLNFDSSIDLIEEELEVVMMTCPKMKEIKIDSNAFTPRIICNLTKFKRLVNLNIHVASNFNPNVEDDSQLWERTCLDNATFPSLTKLIFSDSRDSWISIGYFFRILEMCPRLDTLKLWRCDGFSNKIAAELASLMMNGNLKHLSIERCNLLGPSGIGELLKITSLNELKVLLFATNVEKQHFDSHPLHDDAKKYKVDLKLTVLVDNRGLF